MKADGMEEICNIVVGLNLGVRTSPKTCLRGPRSKSDTSNEHL